MAGTPSRPKSPMSAIQATVRRIPKGKVATYGQVARAAGLPGAARVVVWALRRSGERLPWHRVVGAGGHIRLPGPGGLEQRMRLEGEGIGFRGARIRMDQHEFHFEAGMKSRAG